MAISSMASLFFSVVLLGFVVKNVDGVRGLSPATTAMVETEVTSWDKDPCEKYEAKRDEKYRHRCKCPEDRPEATKACGGFGLVDDFILITASPGCRCVTAAERQESLLRLPVAASALKFCEAVAEHSHRPHEAEDHFNPVERSVGPMKIAMDDALKKTSPEICQHALVGVINKTEAEKAPWAKKASKLSQKGSAEDDEDDEKYGRMQPVKESATNSTEKELWEHALARVCKDECEGLVDMMKKKAKDLAYDVAYMHIPFAQTCAERVVKQVEAEVLGCCGRSCGFNGQTCLLWPFFSPKEKVDWEVECCAEMSILKNSSRELMCNSVLPDRLAIAASKFDLNEQAGTDIGKVLIGQNASLVWTKEGARRFGFNTGDKVSMDFLVKHQKVGEEYLRLGYFRETPITKMLDEATSLMEVSSQDSTCDFGKFKKQCPPNFMNTYTKACQDSWMVAEEREEQDFKEQVEDLGFGNCSVNKPQYVAAPEDCDKLANQSSDEILVVYFTHEHDREEGPIACVTVGKKQCHGMAQWWTEIQLKSVQDVMNGPEIRDYTDRVYYVKVKANQ